jgi:hypothetical protein
LGIRQPSDIDLDAIAWTLGARVRYRPLVGCEARIVGKSDEAVISVNSRSSSARRRFSLAHELGHWQHHRGQFLFCRSTDIGSDRGKSQVERVANRFAAELLMPSYLFDPLLAHLEKPSFASFEQLAESFGVSRTAAAIRAVGRGHSPAILVCHGAAGLRWSVPSATVPDRWRPMKELSPDSTAFAVQFGKLREQRQARKVKASAWFGIRDADRFDIREETVRSTAGETLTLLLLDDGRMLAS